MKKKPRVSPSTPYYSTEPAVSRTKIAGQPPVSSGALANRTNKVVPKNPARLSGLAGYTDRTRLPSKPSGITVPKLGSKMNFPTQGKLRKGKK